ncbi:hypothetical protein NURINAE_01139 [Candidatus Nitrosacidococcus sp. I8]|nr:hypothetical protein NURINAE_01139 [Candidatus Nitrosacidococcus sp. I8]
MATSANSKQMITGKSFEYALLIQLKEKLKEKISVKIIENSAFIIAKDCFNLILDSEKSEYLLSASFAVNFLMDLEPRLSNDIDKNDILQLEILTDYQGESGDVRDILIIRSVQKWEIGISAKNNHRAVKHSRLSSDIDFGEKWLGIKASKAYFDAVSPIFQYLKIQREESNRQKKWSELEDYHSLIYVPILSAFIDELKRLDRENPNEVARNLVLYLVGNKDFYKVIKSKNLVEIHAYNFHGTLSLPFRNKNPKYHIPKIELPSKVLAIDFKKDSNTT